MLILCQKCSKTHLRASLIPKIFPGVISPDPRKGGGRGGEGRERQGLRHGCWGDGRPVAWPKSDKASRPTDNKNSSIAKMAAQ